MAIRLEFIPEFHFATRRTVMIENTSCLNYFRSDYFFLVFFYILINFKVLIVKKSFVYFLYCFRINSRPNSVKKILLQYGIENVAVWLKFNNGVAEV